MKLRCPDGCETEHISVLSVYKLKRTHDAQILFDICNIDINTFPTVSQLNIYIKWFRRYEIFSMDVQNCLLSAKLSLL